MLFRYCFLLLLALNLQAQPPLLDERDGTIYPTVRIGKQVWMQENLRYALPGAVALPPQVPENYGYLYTWKAAMQACPEGWHLPSDAEWMELERYLGMPENELDLHSKFRGANKAIATQLAAQGHWKGYDSYAARYGKSGFKALPAGSAIRNIDYNSFEELLEKQLDTFPPPVLEIRYGFIGTRTSFWSSTLDTHRVTRTSPFVRSIEQQYIDVYRFPSGQHVYYSCRCIRNEKLEQ